MSEQSLSVTFRDSCDVSASACEISLEHDDVLNGGSSGFELGEQIFYKVLPADDYSCYASNGGTISVLCPEKIGSITERVSFNGEDKATLTQPIYDSFSFSWVGSAFRTDTHEKVTPNVSAQNESREITLLFPVYGIVEVTYNYSYVSIGFSPINPGEQLILVCRVCEEIDEQACASLLEDIKGTVFEEVVLVITDACESDVKVAGAQVVVDGNLIDGVSGEDGRIEVGLLAKGNHSIKITAPAYVPSDQDSLSNDEIIVE
jgi:hypothetical protein